MATTGKKKVKKKTSKKVAKTNVNKNVPHQESGGLNNPAGFLEQLKALKASIGPPSGWLYLLKTFTKFATKTALVLFLFVCLVVAFHSYPSGALILRFAPDYQGGAHKEAIIEHFAIATARMGEFAKYQKLLSIETEDSSNIPNINTEPISAIALGSDDATLNLNVEAGNRSLSVEGQIDLLGILASFATTIYNWFGLQDYFLVVTSYSDSIACPDEDENRRTIPSCQRIVVRLAGEDRIPNELTGDANEVRDQLAIYLFRNLTDEKTRITTDGFIDNQLVPADELSRSLPSLRNTATGFEILRLGTIHLKCKKLSAVDCNHEAEKTFRRAIDQDPRNGHAHFGLGVTNATIALSTFYAGNPPKTPSNVYALLRESNQNIQYAASISTYLSKFEEATDLKDLVHTSDDLSEFVEAYKNAVWQRNRGLFERAKDKLQPIRARISKMDAYSGIRPFYESLYFDISLRATNDVEKKRAILEEFGDYVKDADRTPRLWFLHVEYGNSACRFGEEALSSREKALDSLIGALRLAPDVRSYMQTRGFIAWCLASMRKGDEASVHLTEIKNFLDGEIPKGNKERYEVLHYLVGAVHAILGDYATAADHLVESAKLDRNTLTNISNSQWFEQFRQQGAEEHERVVKEVLLYYARKSQNSQTGGEE